MKQAPIALEDRIQRALGTLKYARIMTSDEAAMCLSNVRLGVDLGLIKGIPISILNECMILIQQGFVQQYAGTTLSNRKRLFKSKIIT